MIQDDIAPVSFAFSLSNKHEASEDAMRRPGFVYFSPLSLSSMSSMKILPPLTSLSRPSSRTPSGCHTVDVAQGHS
jgi:hypothetical protein